jgi:ectoine hydroxylase-related dioxygenase (phytanoyl-CoA dioxygenase family)
MATQLRHADTLRSEVALWTDRLFEEGYAIVPNIIDPAIVRALDADFADIFDKTPFSRGNFYGTRTKRFGRALVRSPHAATLIQNELVLGIVERSLAPWCDTVQLNLTQSIAVHPGAPAQVPHRDQDMFPGPKGNMEYGVNVMWPLTRFTRENGATALWRRSHRMENNAYIGDENAVIAEMEIGSALIFLGSTLHGQSPNTSDEIRRGLIVGYSLSWLKQFENQYLCYPPEVARTFPPGLAELVGYGSIPSNLNSYEGQSPMVLLQDEVPEHLGAIDAFRPDQVAAIDHYYQTGKPKLV